MQKLQVPWGLRQGIEKIRGAAKNLLAVIILRIPTVVAPKSEDRIMLIPIIQAS